MSGINRAGRGHLLSDLQRLFDGELLLAVNLVPEGVAFNERGDEVQEAVCLTGVMQRQDVRMLQIRSRLYLSEEALGKLASFPPELLSRDQVSVRLLAARRRMLGLRIPAVVQNALYRGGDPMYGWRIGSQVSVTAMLALLVVAALPSGPRLPEPPGPLAEGTPPTPECDAFTVGYNADGSCFDEPPRPLVDPLVPVTPGIDAGVASSTFCSPCGRERRVCGASAYRWIRKRGL